MQVLDDDGQRCTADLAGALERAAASARAHGDPAANAVAVHARLRATAQARLDEARARVRLVADAAEERRRLALRACCRRQHADAGRKYRLLRPCCYLEQSPLLRSQIIVVRGRL